MNKIIIRFRYENLRNEAHAEFHTTFNALVTRYTAAALGIDPLYMRYKPLYDEEIAALDQIIKSALTPVIKDLERRRDRLLKGFTTAVKSCLHHFDDVKREAARKIMFILKHYGNIARKPYDEETAAIEDLHRELTKPENSALVAALGLGEWLEKLIQASRHFEGMMMNRYEEIARRPNLHMREVRRKVDAATREILHLLESLVRVKGPDTNRDFLTELNAVMKRYKDILSQEAGRRKLKVES
jgi:hypothetical protein